MSFLPGHTWRIGMLCDVVLTQCNSGAGTDFTGWGHSLLLLIKPQSQTVGFPGHSHFWPTGYKFQGSSQPLRSRNTVIFSCLLQSGRVHQFEKVQAFYSVGLWEESLPQDSWLDSAMNPWQEYLRNDAMLFWMHQGEGRALFTSPTNDDVNLDDPVICVCQFFLDIWLVSEGRYAKTMSISYSSSDLRPPALSSSMNHA